MNEPEISIIIPVLNEGSKIERCLESVFNQSRKPCEVIIIDGQSKDDTVERAKKFPVKVFYESSNSIARGRQIGVENSRGSYIAFTDADCVVDKDWLANLVKEFNDGVIAVGGGIKNASSGFWEKAINLAVSSFIGGAQTIQGRFFEDRRLVKSISACNSMYRKEVIAKVGGFNVNLPGGEELELNKRLAQTGKLLYTPEAIVTHYHVWTLKKFAKKMFRYGKERGMVRAWNMQFLPAFVAPLVFLSAIITPWILVSVLSLYALILLAMGIKFAAQAHNFKFIVGIPIVYIIEHVTYSAGIWRGLIKSRQVKA